MLRFIDWIRGGRLARLTSLGSLGACYSCAVHERVRVRFRVGIRVQTQRLDSLI